MTTDEVFEVYIRTAEGDTYHTSLREGLTQFLSDDGYRLTFNIEGVEIVLRRNSSIHEIQKLDVLLENEQKSVEVVATIRGIDGN